MANTYDDVGVNTRKAIPTSRLGTRNLVWYSFTITYDLFNGEAEDNYTAYDASDSFYHHIVEGIQEAGELYHLGAPTNVLYFGFIFAVADNDASEPDNGQYFQVGYAGEVPDLTISSIYQAIAQRLGGTSGWNLNPCADAGYGILAL
jgi:hypothetical protein